MQLNPVNTALTTVGNGTLLTAALIGTIISRSGPVGAFTDTIDTSSNIVHALAGIGGASFVVTYINNVASIATLQATPGDTNMTLTGSVAIPANSTALILFTRGPRGASTVTAVVLARFANA